MAKDYVKIGYGDMRETSPSVWTDKITERPYYAEVGRNFKKTESSEYLNDNINISNEISIVADPFAYDNFHSIRYVKFMGTKWKVISVEVQYPRLRLTIGGVYNENSIGIR